MNNVIPLQNSPERVSLLPIAPGVDFATALSLRRMATSTGATPAYLLAPSIEDTVRGAVRQTSAGSYLSLDPAVSKRLVENIKKTVGDIGGNAQRPVLLTSMDIRRYLRKMIVHVKF